MYPDYDIEVRLFAFKEEALGECQEAFDEFLSNVKRR